MSLYAFLACEGKQLERFKQVWVEQRWRLKPFWPELIQAFGRRKQRTLGDLGFFPVSFCVFDILVKSKICPGCFQFLQGAYQLGDIFASLCDLGSFEGQLHSPLSHLKSQLQLKRKKKPGLPWASWRQRWGFSDGATDVMRDFFQKKSSGPERLGAWTKSKLMSSSDCARKIFRTGSALNGWICNTVSDEW